LVLGGEGADRPSARRREIDYRSDHASNDRDPLFRRQAAMERFVLPTILEKNRIHLSEERIGRRRLR